MNKSLEALNKCETQKSYENVRYTLVDDQLRDYIEQDLERLEILDKLVTDDCIAGNQVGLDIVNNLIERANKYKEKAKHLEKENKEWKEANRMLIKTIKIIKNCLENSTSIEQIMNNIIQQVSKEVLEDEIL